jgi:putative phage-type endonuclease
METQIIKSETKEQWLDSRKSFIGGSEMAAMLGLDPYKSPYDLYLDKTGQSEPFADNKHTLAGKFLEDGIAKYWEYETGNKIIKSSDNDIIYKHPEHRIGGTPDRRYFINGSTLLSERSILEVKTTMKIIDYEDVPMSWFIQPNTYCGLLGYSKFSLTWFEFFTKEIKYIEYDFDAELYKMCCEEADNFWNNHVLLDIPPPLTTASDINKVFPNSKEDKSIIASDEVMELYGGMIELHRDKSKLQKQYTAKAEQIKVIMRDSEFLLTPQLETLFTFKSGSRARTLRIKEL